MIKVAAFLVPVCLALIACGSPPASPVPDGHAVAPPAPAAQPEPGDVLPKVAPIAPRQPGDLAPCPGINSDIRRPPGSNCLGITPDRCGADKVLYLVGYEATEERERFISGFAVGGFRWIPHMTAVTDDLNPDRLNVEIDSDGKIARVDCY